MSETIEVAKTEFERLQRRVAQLEEQRDKALAEMVRFATFLPEMTPEQFRADNEMYEEGDEHAPFMSEAFMYVLLGKEDARTVRSRFRRIYESLGRTSEGDDFDDLLNRAYTERWRGNYQLAFETNGQREQFSGAVDFNLKGRWRFCSRKDKEAAAGGATYVMVLHDVTLLERRRIDEAAETLGIKTRLWNVRFVDRDA